MRHENTLRGVQEAIDAGVDGVEIDLQLSADGQVFVFHDLSLRRLAGHEVVAGQLSWPQLEAIGLHCGENIPLLAELLELWPTELSLNLELKEGGPALVQALASILAGFELDDVVLSSFDASMLNAAGILPWPRAMLIETTSPAWVSEGGAHTLGCAWIHLEACLLSDTLVADYARRNIEVGVWGATSAQEESQLEARGIKRIISDFRVPQRE